MNFHPRKHCSSDLSRNKNVAPILLKNWKKNVICLSIVTTVFQLQLYSNPRPNVLFQICASSFRIFFFELSALGVTSLMHFPAFLRDNVANICCMLLENQMKVFISKKILFCKSGMVVLKTWLLYWCIERGGKGCKLLYDKIQQNFQISFC